MLRLKKYVGYSIVILLVNLVLFLILLLYTPFFSNAKKVYVESAMATANHQWLAIAFLSDERIKNISSKGNSTSLSKSNSNTVDIPKEDDNTIDYFNITSTRYIGHGLVIHNPKRVKMVSSENNNIGGQYLEEIIKKNNAICGVNGGGFSRDNEHGINTPVGILMSSGKLIYPSSENTSCLDNLHVGAIDKNGLLMVGNYKLDELKKLNVQEAISFGPVLIKNGKPLPIEYNIMWGGDSSMSQRTLLGQRQDGSIILVVTEGIIHRRIATSLNEAQQFMLDLGAINAINLDGGNSVVMYNDGKLVNKSSTRNILSSAIIVK